MPRKLSSSKKSPRGSYFDHVEHAISDLRILDVVGTVDTGMAHELGMRLRYMDSQSHEPITMYLNTPGGSIADGLAIFDLITTIKKTTPINIIASGGCMSMGTIIMQAGTRRMCTPHTHFMLHELQGGSVGSLSEMKDAQAHFDQLQKTLDGILRQRTGKSADTLVKNLKRRDWYIDAPTALKLNLIDEVLEA